MSLHCSMQMNEKAGFTEHGSGSPDALVHSTGQQEGGQSLGGVGRVCSKSLASA